jgi:hypothetical protein
MNLNFATLVILTTIIVIIYLEKSLEAWKQETQAKLKLAEVMSKSDRYDKAGIYSILEYIFTTFGPDMPLHGIMQELEKEVDFKFNPETKLITYNQTKVRNLAKPK